MRACLGRVYGSTFRCVAGTACLVGAAFFTNSASAGDLSFGKPGEPVQLVVGYQPYYTEAWSGVVMRGKEFWKRYLPKESTADSQVGQQAAFIVTARLQGRQHTGYSADSPPIGRPTKQTVAYSGMCASPGS